MAIFVCCTVLLWWYLNIFYTGKMLDPGFGWIQLQKIHTFWRSHFAFGRLSLHSTCSSRFCWWCFEFADLIVLPWFDQVLQVVARSSEYHPCINISISPLFFGGVTWGYQLHARSKQPHCFHLQHWGCWLSRVLVWFWNTARKYRCFGNTFSGSMRPCLALHQDLCLNFKVSK